jgi:hypothetical protein
MGGIRRDACGPVARQGLSVTGRRRRITSLTILGMSLVSACQFDAITVPNGRERPVVHAVLNPWASEEVILVERTLTGRANIDDDQRENRNDPIVSGGGIPIRNALVVLYNEANDSVVAVEDALTNNGRGAGVYRFRNPAAPRQSDNPALPAMRILPGGTYRLKIITTTDDTVRGITKLPRSTTVPPSGGRFFNRDRDTLRFFWDAVPETQRYLVRIDSPWGPMFLFTEQLEARLPGNMRNIFQESFPRVFIPGFQSTVSVAAVDPNYFDYYRSGNDPFTGTGLINRLEGGIGVFGSLSELYSYTVFVSANLDEPVEGWYELVRREGPLAPFTMKLYVESSAQGFDFITGEHFGSIDLRSGSLVGIRAGDKLNMALLESDMADTVATFSGNIVGDTLIGVIHADGLTQNVKFKKTARTD